MQGYAGTVKRQRAGARPFRKFIGVLKTNSFLQQFTRCIKFAMRA